MSQVCLIIVILGILFQTLIAVQGFHHVFARDFVQYFNCTDPKYPVTGETDWETLSNFPRHNRELYNHSAIEVNGHLYVSHGTEEDRSFCKFDPRTRQWDPINFRHPSEQCALVYLDGWIYALGRDDYDEEGFLPARRYNIRDDKEEVLHPESESIQMCTTAVAYMGKVLVYSKGFPFNPPDYNESNFTLSVYDPVINKWFVLSTEQHRVNLDDDVSFHNIALVIHENKCYRVHFEDVANRRKGYRYTKPKVNELVFDFEGEQPSFRLGESQEQFGLTEIPVRYSHFFCIDGELFVFGNRCALRTGQKIAAIEDIFPLLQIWEGVYMCLDKRSAVTHYTLDVNYFKGKGSDNY